MMLGAIDLLLIGLIVGGYLACALLGLAVWESAMHARLVRWIGFERTTLVSLAVMNGVGVAFIVAVLALAFR